MNRVNFQHLLTRCSLPPQLMAAHGIFVLPSPTLLSSPVEIPVRGSGKMIRAPSSSTKKDETTSMMCTKRDTLQTLSMMGLVWQSHTSKGGRAPEPSLRNAVAQRHPVSGEKLTRAVSLFLQVWEACSLVPRLSPLMESLEIRPRRLFQSSIPCRHFAHTLNFSFKSARSLEC